jgi:hypothetical protein
LPNHGCHRRANSSRVRDLSSHVPDLSLTHAGPELHAGGPRSPSDRTRGSLWQELARDVPGHTLGDAGQECMPVGQAVHSCRTSGAWWPALSAVLQDQCCHLPDPSQHRSGSDHRGRRCRRRDLSVDSSRQQVCEVRAGGRLVRPGGRVLRRGDHLMQSSRTPARGKGTKTPGGPSTRSAKPPCRPA